MKFPYGINSIVKQLPISNNLKIAFAICNTAYKAIVIASCLKRLHKSLSNPFEKEGCLNQIKNKKEIIAVLLDCNIMKTPIEAKGFFIKKIDILKKTNILSKGISRALIYGAIIIVIRALNEDTNDLINMMNLYEKKCKKTLSKSTFQIISQLDGSTLLADSNLSKGLIKKNNQIQIIFTFVMSYFNCINYDITPKDYTNVCEYINEFLDLRHGKDPSISYMSRKIGGDDEDYTSIKSSIKSFLTYSDSLKIGKLNPNAKEINSNSQHRQVADTLSLLAQSCVILLGSNLSSYYLPKS